jgi:hypothetical protein
MYCRMSEFLQSPKFRHLSSHYEMDNRIHAAWVGVPKYARDSSNVVLLREGQIKVDEQLCAKRNCPLHIVAMLSTLSSY